jgi:hypothetical protein
MNDEYSFRMERESYKSQNLIYEEPGHKLVVYLEMSGVKHFDWVGCDVEFREWTEPAGELIPADKQAEILGRLDRWSRHREPRLRIDIGPPIDMNEFFLEQERRGFKVERRPDGTVAVSHPKRRI